MTKASRRLAVLQAAALGLLTAVVDAGPSVIRFGAGRSARNRLFARSLPSVHDDSAPAISRVGVVPAEAGEMPTALLVTRSMGVGGVEAVVASLARGLPGHGMRVVVLCETGGATADALRSEQVRVSEAADRDSALTLIKGLAGPTVAQLHNAPDHLVSAVEDAGCPLIPVIHTTDVNLGAAGWSETGRVADLAEEVVAVSETVRAFYVQHLPCDRTPPVEVIPNGVGITSSNPAAALANRRRLSVALGVDLKDSIVLLCLARYDMQKNIPGLVSAFLAAASTTQDVHLVVAGPVEDWLEHAFADAIRRSHPASDRVHFMGAGSSEILMSAADAFILDSFFEGWPIAASEAAMSGIPLLLSEAGGAEELIGPGGNRGYRFSNPAGVPADMIDIAAIRRARRRAGRQVNVTEASAAIIAVAQHADEWRVGRSQMAEAARKVLTSSTMIAAHAAILIRAAERRRTQHE